MISLTVYHIQNEKSKVRRSKDIGADIVGSVDLAFHLFEGKMSMNVNFCSGGEYSIIISSKVQIIRWKLLCESASYNSSLRIKSLLEVLWLFEVFMALFDYN